MTPFIGTRRQYDEVIGDKLVVAANMSPKLPIRRSHTDLPKLSLKNDDEASMSVTEAGTKSIPLAERSDGDSRGGGF